MLFVLATLYLVFMQSLFFFFFCGRHKPEFISRTLQDTLSPLCPHFFVWCFILVCFFYTQQQPQSQRHRAFCITHKF